MKIILLLCLSLSLSFVQFAQSDQHYLDSLEKYLSKKDDSLKLRAISDLAWEYNSIDVNRAIRLSKKGVLIAQKIKNEPAVGRAYTDLGASYYFKRDFDSAVYYYKKSLPITIKSKDKEELAYVYNQLGALYKERTEYQTSLHYSFLSLKIYQRLKLKHETALLYNNIGVTYEELKNFTLAHSYYQRALTLNKAEKDESGIARNYVGLGNVFLNQKNFDKAYDYYSKSAVIFEKLGWGIEYSVAMNNMGDALDGKGMYTQAVEKREEALKIAEEIEDIQGQAKYHLYVSDDLMDLKRFPQALSHIQKAEKLFSKIRSYEIEIKLNEMYAKYYFGSNNFEKGNRYLNRFHELKDSVYSSELSSNVAAMEVTQNVQELRIRNAETKARNLKLVNENLRANQQLNTIILITLLIVFTGAIVF